VVVRVSGEALEAKAAEGATVARAAAMGAMVKGVVRAAAAAALVAGSVEALMVAAMVAGSWVAARE
jgi:hypothetical protein